MELHKDPEGETEVCFRKQKQNQKNQTKLKTNECDASESSAAVALMEPSGPTLL